MGQWFDPIPRRNHAAAAIRFMTDYLQSRELSSEPIGIAASIRKTDPPNVRFTVIFSVRDIHTI